jgi:hypothetical protein
MGLARFKQQWSDSEVPTYQPLSERGTAYRMLLWAYYTSLSSLQLRAGQNSEALSDTERIFFVYRVNGGFSGSFNSTNASVTNLKSEIRNEGTHNVMRDVGK